jgi:putative membrane protein
VGLACLAATATLAQQQFGQPGQPPQGARPQGATPQGASQDVNQFLASCWAAKNQAEIEISQLAQQQAHNPDVKQFAQTMVQEHRQLQQKLDNLTQTPGAGSNPAIGQLISIEKQIVEKSTDQMQQKLDEKSGKEFDKCYLAGQVACHMQAKAALSVISQETSGQLQQLARDHQQKIDQHLEKAERLLEQQTAGPQQASATRDPNLRPASAQQ